MANILNRTSKVFRSSVNTPDYPVSDWIINPDLSAVENVEVKYWIIEGDTVREATATEKTQIDSDNLAQHKIDCKADIDQRYTSTSRHISETDRDQAKTDVDAATNESDCTTIRNNFTGD